MFSFRIWRRCFFNRNKGNLVFLLYLFIQINICMSINLSISLSIYQYVHNSVSSTLPYNVHITEAYINNKDIVIIALCRCSTCSTWRTLPRLPRSVSSRRCRLPPPRKTTQSCSWQTFVGSERKSSAQRAPTFCSDENCSLTQSFDLEISFLDASL